MAKCLKQARQSGEVVDISSRLRHEGIHKLFWAPSAFPTTKIHKFSEPNSLATNQPQGINCAFAGLDNKEEEADKRQAS